LLPESVCPCSNSMPDNSASVSTVTYKPFAVAALLVGTVCALWYFNTGSVAQVAQTSPVTSERTWTKSTENGAFVVTLDAQSSRIPLREFLEWRVDVRDPDGVPVYPARFAIGGGMPGHGHGLPSQPRVSKHLADGQYLISGIKFNMAGDWLLMLDIESESQVDRVGFEIQIDF